MSSIDGLSGRNTKKTTLRRTTSKSMDIKSPQKASRTTGLRPTTRNIDGIARKGSVPPRRKVLVKVVPEEQTDIPSTKSQQKREDFLKPVTGFDFSLDSTDIKKEDLKKAKKNKKGKKINKKRCIILASIAGVLVVAAAVVLIWGNDIIAKITGGKSGIWDLAGLVDENYVDLKTDSKGRTNILVFGTSGYDMSGSEGSGVHDGAQLTDSIMLVSLDQTTGDVAMVSLPRDLKAGMTCTATGKVNEVYWCANQDGNNEEAGAEALMNKVTEIFGVDFQYYVHVNWAALTTVVDAIGGITVTLDEDINDYYYTKTVIQAGIPTTLTGEQALGLARARHGTEQGDFTRGNSQQKILIAIKDKVLSEGVDLGGAMDLVSAVGDNVRMNFNLDEIKSGVHLLSTIDLSAMRQVPITDWKQGISIMTTANIGGVSYVVPSAGVGNYTEVKAYIAKMFDSNPAVREEPTVEVLNGSEQVGVASVEQEKLIAEEFRVPAVDDAPTNDFVGYSVYVLNEDKVGSKKKLEEIYKTQAKSADELPEGISSDCDFVVIVGN